MIRKTLFAALLTGCMAFSTLASAVQVAASGVGQVLLGAMYSTTGGYRTTITVFNASLVDAVKAKMVFRSQKYGAEVLGFLLYLRPGELFEGDLSSIYTVGEGATFNSTSSSILLGTSTSGIPVFASRAAPARFSLAAAPSGDTNTIGHIEVFSAYAVRGSIDTPTGTVDIHMGMSTEDLYKIFSSSRKTLSPDKDTPNRISSVTPGMVQLKGRIETGSPILGTKWRMQMVALEPGANSQTGGFSTNVIYNPDFDVSVQEETLLGQKFGTVRDFVGDSIVDIEAALASAQKAAIAPSSIESQIKIFAFPTKYRHKGKAICTGSATPASSLAYSAPFLSSGNVQYNEGIIDATGKIATVPSSVCIVEPCGENPEVQTFAVNSVNTLFSPTQSTPTAYATYTTFTEATGCPYLGVPVIALTLGFWPSAYSSLAILEPMFDTSVGWTLTDRVFNYAEKLYPAYFNPPVASASNGYVVWRNYANGASLMQKSGDLYVILPDAPGHLQNLGSLLPFVRMAKDAGF